jgi:hypothetical protein
VLDVAFGDDVGRKRAGHAAQNFSALIRIALNLLKRDKRCKLGIHGKRLTAAWDHPYLLHLLGVENQDASALPKWLPVRFIRPLNLYPDCIASCGAQ